MLTAAALGKKAPAIVIARGEAYLVEHIITKRAVCRRRAQRPDPFEPGPPPL